jgi:magnesium transporter
LFSDLRKRAQKIGQPPGTPQYTGTDKTPPRITIIQYSQHDFHEVSGSSLEECLPLTPEPGVVWVNVTGLSDANLIDKIAKQFNLHPLTIEDILNIQQRPKVEEFDGYLFMILKKITWNEKKQTFFIEQFSCVLGKNFVLSFQERETTFFKAIEDRLKSSPSQRLRQQGGDYLIYRFIDAIIDQYFLVLEGIGEQIEKVEERIITSPTPQNSRTLYKIKRQMLLLRKAMWPMREVISHLTQTEEEFISSFTRIYLRDVYDHTIQAIDTIETFRDMLSSMLDVYLSSLTTRMNEVMKVLTIIATIFIPITFVASVYGMNFAYMPELQYKYGYPIVLSVMLSIAIGMLIYFRKKKWI